MSDQELQEQINALCNGTIDAEGMRCLEEALMAERVNRDTYRQAMNLHATLYERCEAETDTASVGFSPPRWMLSLVAALVLGLLAIVIVQLVESPPGAVANTEEDAPYSSELGVGQSLAVLTQAVDVVWSEGSTPLNIGAALPAGTVSLEAGLLHIDFLAGAYVTLEGPAKLELVSSSRGVLHYGKLRANVPEQAKGFSIVTSDAEFIDLGTEFGIECGPSGRSELHVFEGEVEVRDGKKKPLLVRSGGGLRYDQDLSWEKISSDSGRFTDIATIARLAAENDSGRLDSWQRNHLELAKHPSLVAYYDFEPPLRDSRLLPDLGSGGHDGALVGCVWAEGRWPGKGALEFKQSADRVRLDIPGEFESITMTAWLRIDGFDRHFNSILLSDKFDNGHAHWQVKHDGVIDLGVCPPGEIRELYLSGRELGQSDLGRWVHLAVTYDQAGRAVSHFVDGELVAKLPISGNADFPLRFGPSEIGNFNPVTPGTTSPVRNLNGRIDELAIFGDALGESEIQALYELGRP